MSHDVLHPRRAMRQADLVTDSLQSLQVTGLQVIVRRVTWYSKTIARRNMRKYCAEKAFAQCASFELTVKWHQ